MATTDPELEREQAHLAESRAQLARMRERTAAMDSAAAGDWVSREYLESTFALRMKQLADDPTVPLFFGRIDTVAPGGSDGAGESFHIGRRHVSDPTGEPMVIDWRAPVSLPFYRASRAEPMDVERRRRYGFQSGRLTAYEDEDLAHGAGSGDGPDDRPEHSAILEAEIERPRVGPMRDIVATIQPEQDVIVRSGLGRSVCVQGAPGTGKTAVGLHRAAYLLYAHREQLTRQGVLVVGPNASFLRYIRDVLPALGEIDATQTTIEELAARTLTTFQPRNAVTAVEDARVATLKGDPRMAAVLERALWAHVTTPTESLVVPRGARRWRVAAYEAEELVASLRQRGVRYGAARAMVPQSLAHRVLVKMELAGDSPDDRVQNAVARSKPVKDYAASLWPAVDPARLVWRLLSDADLLATAAEGILDADEQAALLWDRPSKAPTSAHWSLADAVLLDEAADLVERTPSVAHIVADEAQDLSPMMLRMLARRSATGSLTVLGDLAQATTPWATRTWSEALAHLGKPDAHVEELTRGFRVPADVIEYAARLLPVIAPGLTPPTSVRRARGDLTILDGGDVVATVRDVIGREGSIGLIAPDARVAAIGAALREAGIGHAVLGEEEGADTEFEQHLDLVPASLAKGLEFDHVVVVEPAAIVDGEPDRVTGLRRLYVCLTRAVTTLVVLHDEPLPGNCEDEAVPDHPVLEDRWPLPDADDVRDALLAAYAHPARGYHDTLHLTEVLDRLDELPGGDAVAVRLAAWFHDGVYDGEPGAEERSAQWAERALAGHDPALVAEVARLVRLTETHRPADDDAAGCLLSDADLAILAAPAGRYAAYVAAVRREYARVPDDAFATGRAAILRDLLAKPHLFHTAYAREHWEARARANVEAELSERSCDGEVPRPPGG